MAEIKLDCPHCAGTGDATTGDRHAGTNMDTCRPCGGTGKIDAATGQSPEASAPPFSWEETARNYANGQQFYSEVVSKIGHLFGDAARTADDGSVQDSVLALRVPELVEGLIQEVEVLRRQRMAPERERELLEAANRHLQAERDISRAYVRLRQMIPGALLTPPGPTPEAVWAVTEEATRQLLERARAAEQHPWIDRCAWIAEHLISLFPRDPELAPERADPDHPRQPLELPHLLFMALELRDRKLDSQTKACRWLGWLQAGLVSCQVTTLEDMKELNLASGDAVPRMHGGTFQDRNLAFIEHVAADDPSDVHERMARFLEEALELCQALGATEAAVHELVAYVFSRPVGEPGQEMGGTKVTLAGLASYAKLDMDACGEVELERCNTPEIIAKIRGKRAGRPRDGVSLLPGRPKVDPETDFSPI